MQDLKVTSLELSKKLKEAGYKQEGVWWWVWAADNGWLLWSFRTHSTDIKQSMTHFVAPTVTELGERLPETFTTYRKGKSWFMGRIIGSDLRKVPIAVAMDTEANARAKMWLYLKEKELI